MSRQKPGLVDLLGRVPDSEIARQHGLSRARVGQIRSSLGVSCAPRVSGKPFDHLLGRQTDREIGVAFGVHEGTVGARRRALGIAPCPRAGLRALAKDPQEGAQLRAWRVAAGLSQREVGRVLGITGVAVLNKEHGRRPLLAADVTTLDAKYPGAAMVIRGKATVQPIDLPPVAVQVLALPASARDLTGPLGTILGREVSADDVRHWRVQTGVRRRRGRPASRDAAIS